MRAVLGVLSVLGLVSGLWVSVSVSGAPKKPTKATPKRGQKATPKRGQKAAKAPQKATKAKPKAGKLQDKGVFFLKVKGSSIAEIRYTWWASGRYEGHRTIRMAGQKLVTRLSVEVDGKGRWKKMHLKRPQGDIVMERKGKKVVTSYRGKKLELKLKAGAIPYDNFSPALLSWVVRRYQKSPKHKVQKSFSFPMLFSGRAIRACSIKRVGQEVRRIGGTSRSFAKYRLVLVSTALTLWADAKGLIYLVDVPTQYARFVRKGYGSLGKKPAKKGKKGYAILKEANVKVPMRDKLELATDIYRPKARGRFPVILVRTPYKKEMGELNARYFARQGYVYAIQDCRGRFSSPGVWEPFVNEAKDGYDAIEWLARQPWSNGKVGMIGGSYVGWVQWWAASLRPPHLVTMIPNVSPPDPFYNIPYEYGAFFLLGAIWWAEVLETKATGSISGVAFEKISRRRYSSLLRTLPVIDLDKKVFGKKNPYWRKWIQHPTNDSYWQRANFLDKLKHLRIPVFHQSGWFDGDGIGSKLNYLKMRSHKHRNQKLILGPWGHTAQAHRRARGRDFGPRALVDLQAQYLRWFDRWLKGASNGIDKEPLVQLFVMGSNVWLKGNSYPLEGTRMTRWYLGSKRGANTAKGDGSLALSQSKGRSSDRYVYDPGDPTPAPHYYEAPKRKKGSTWSVSKLKKLRKKHHQTTVSTRKDILVYTSAPMSKPYTFVGPISAVLYASSSAKDTDWYVNLVEVDAKGGIFPLVHGKLRARFRRSMSKPSLLTPHKVVRYTLDLWQTGITLPKGSRLRVEIASASFPLFSRNLNTGGHNERDTRYAKATQTLYHSTRYPSHILLPEIPAARVQAALKRARKK